eukprot:5554526-Prymnesium_polylepis.1
MQRDGAPALPTYTGRLCGMSRLSSDPCRRRLEASLRTHDRPSEGTNSSGATAMARRRMEPNRPQLSRHGRSCVRYSFGARCIRAIFSPAKALQTVPTASPIAH